MKKLTKRQSQLIYTAKGDVRNSFKRVMDCLRKDGKFYPNTWNGSGRYLSLSSCKYNVIEVLKEFSFKYEIGNDAPRGGQEGEYIKISSRAANRLLSYLK